MANADFSQNNKQTAPGGFDAGSYREKAKPEQTVRLTPRQQKLAALEAKLPAALSTRAAALALSVVVMLAAFAATRFFSVNIILIILVCGVIGALDTLYLQKKEGGK